MSPIRIGRLAAERKMRRRRLDAYQHSQPWPGKHVAWRSELLRYDRYLLLPAQMLKLPVPELAGGSTLAPERRAALDDQLAVAGLDVFSPRKGVTANIIEDGDLHI